MKQYQEMTQEEATARARAVALKYGWPWRNPVFAKRQRPFIVVGRPYWRLMSSADRRGGNVTVHIDCHTGEVLHKGFARR